ncbi:hypothetical protein ACFY3G_46765 [Streptomyces phaeochromogenes]|uniref:hypothetical protein n=1 Tax=Streptomyces phaeochromogenes TaxID=1923 RepID=UPI0036B074CD
MRPPGSRSRTWAALSGLVPGSKTPPDLAGYEEGSQGRIGSYSATVIDGSAPYNANGTVRKGRFVIARITRGGTSALRSDFDRCGRWPADGVNLGMEDLTPTAPVQKLPRSEGALRCSTAKVGGTMVVHAERGVRADADDPTSVSGVQREAFTILPDGTAVNVSSSSLARTGEPEHPCDWAFLDRLLRAVRYPTQS